MERLIDKTKKYTLCIAGADKLFYFNGFFRDIKSDNFFVFYDERDDIEVILSGRNIVWIKEVPALPKMNYD